MKVYLLAAGYATRMFPLTRDCAKPLLDVAGAPILTHILARVLALEDVSEVVVVTNARFVASFRARAAALDVRVMLRILDDGSTCDDDKLGAIGDLGFALREVPPGEESFLVAAGDNLLAFDLRPLQREFSRRGAPLLAVRSVARDGPSAYNEVTLGADDRVLQFREKPADPQTELAAIALYFLPADVVARLGEYLDTGGKPDAPGHFIAWLVERTPVYAIRLAEGQGEVWFDVGSLEGLASARVSYPPDAPAAE